MQLIRFSVERYRSITSLSEFAVSDLTVLVGPNNQGKSNVLRALDCALNILKFLARHTSWGALKQRTLVYHNVFTPISGHYKWKKDYPIQYQKAGKKNNSSIFVMTFGLDQEESLYIIEKTQICYPFKEIPIKLQINDDLMRISILIPELFKQSESKRFVSFILRYIAQKVNICYIDAERTAETAKQTIEKLVDIRLQKVQSDPTFLDLIKNMRLAFDREMQEMSKQINVNLKTFIPSIKKTDVFFLEKNETPFISLYNRFNINVDDGITTLLSQKGSGVQSLVALFLANYVSNTIGHSDSFILAVDEPESHLHPDAIHNIESVLKSISKNNQVIISTHSPILVQKTNPHKNVIVENHCAHEAVKISDIRTILGVHPADNLINARLILIVEGAFDENTLPHLLSFSSDCLRKAIESKQLMISSAGGTHNLENHIRCIKNSLCEFHILVDNDTAGQDIVHSLINKKIIDNGKYTVLKMNGLKKSEIEDLINPTVYVEQIKDQYNISSDITKQILANKSKWSIKIKTILENKGKRINEGDILSLKAIVSHAVEKFVEKPDPKKELIIPHRKESFLELISILEKNFKAE